MGKSIYRSSFDIMKKNKRLFIFPILTAVLTAGIVVFFIKPTMEPGRISTAVFNTWAVPAPGTSAGVNWHVSLKPLGAAYFSFIYVALIFVASFFNVAFYHEIMNAFGGAPVSLLEGFRFASARIRTIFFWSLVAGLVGIAIRKLEGRSNSFGKFIIGFIGLAWSVASVFAIPTIVISENISNPFIILRRSTAVLKKTWGDLLMGYVGLGFRGLGVILVAFPLMFGGGIFAAFKIGEYWPLFFGFLSWVLFASACIYFLSVLGHVYKCALFFYATRGIVPEPFDTDMMGQAWR